MLGTWNVCWRKLQAGSTAGPTEKPYRGYNWQEQKRGISQAFETHNSTQPTLGARHETIGFNDFSK